MTPDEAREQILTALIAAGVDGADDDRWCTDDDVLSWPTLGWFPSEAGWLCAIQQRFAELYRERETRIEAIVAGWEWVEHETIWSLYAQRWTGKVKAYVKKYDAGQWLASEEIEAAKEAARAAVLRQAKEHPELWHCGEVDE